MIRRTTAWACLLVATVASCRPEASDRRSASADTVFVSDRPETALTGTITLVIGVDSGPDPYVFGDISSVTLDRSGRVVVVDRFADEVRVFSATGDILFRFGRSGAGPGEFEQPCCATMLADDLLWVRDAGNGRLSGFELSESGARYVRGVASIQGGGLRPLPIALHPAGWVVDVRDRLDTRAGQFVYTRHLLDATGKSVSIQDVPPPSRRDVPSVSYESGSSRRWTGGVFFPLFAPVQLVAHAANGDWAMAISSSYSVRWLDADGRQRLLVAGQVADGPRLTPAERQDAEEVAQHIGKAAGSRVNIDIPEHKPPLQALKFDLDGRLWVELTTPNAEPAAADVFDTAGRYVARVTWPKRLDVTDGVVGLQTIAGILRNRLGVEQAALAPLRTADLVPADSAR